MPTTASDDSIRIRVNKELKKEASELLSSMGLNFSDFFRISLLKLVNEKKMPFSRFQYQNDKAEALSPRQI